MTGNLRTIMGVDEAGYGPLLGPLVVGVSVFRAPAIDLRELLPVSADPRGAVPVDDSKRIYRGGLAALERSVLAYRSLAVRAEVPDEPPDGPEPWGLRRPATIPVAAAHEDVARALAALREATGRAGVEVLEVRTRTVPVPEFNRRAEADGTKARVLFEAAAELLAPWLAVDGEVVAVVDRHGGRSRYSELLGESFPDHHHWVVAESRERSAYRFDRKNGVTNVSFEVGADGRHLATALASMAAKYVRELWMAAFNAWFAEHDPDLRPTAGYYSDALRWLEDSRELRRRLGVEEAVLRRVR